jgi:hypothetical protein
MVRNTRMREFNQDVMKRPDNIMPGVSLKTITLPSERQRRGECVAVSRAMQSLM